MGREVEARMSRESAEDRGRPANWCSVGASRLGLAKRKASGGDDDLDFVGVSAGQRVTAELVFDRRKNKGDSCGVV